MNPEPERFDSDVSGVWGRWPSAPALWSYSSLKELESCPRRWMLSRAEYPDIWAHRGYPMVPVAAAEFGTVVHRTVERLVDAFAQAGIASPQGAEAVALLRSIGGFKEVISLAIDERLASYEGNPRVTPERLERLRDELTRRIDDACDQVKAFLGRGTLPVTMLTEKRASQSEAGARQRYPAGHGVHAEREVTSEELRLTGFIDLLIIDQTDVTIMDFKTGAEDPGHKDQVRTYALLWDLDRATNPNRRPATRLCISYPSRQLDVAVPSEGDLRSMEAATAERIEAADAATTEAPPRAAPSQETCILCHVKHLCDAYWPAVPPTISETTTEEWFDFEGYVVRQNGIRSWVLAIDDSGSAEVLLRTPSPGVILPVGRHVRILGVRRSQDPDDEERLVVSMVATSEWFELVENAQ